MTRSKIFLLAAALIAAGAGLYFWQAQKPGAAEQRYKTEAVGRGDIVQTISANGTLNPVVLVNVGTQVSGTVMRLHADFNARVARNQVLAELDPALFEAQVRQDEANLAVAQANLTLARNKEQRAQAQFQKGFISADAMDQAVQALATARAQVAQAGAQLERNRTNLRYTVIRSPVSGVVVARNVDVGQTVAASFQTPTLFQIAGDLAQMQIDTSIAEADIGSIRVDQPVRFSVDAFPDRYFPATVKQIRLNPAIQQNVVTYDVVLAAANPEGSLLPGMTAHVYITAARRDDVLRVPNAALRFKPAREESTKPEGGARPGKQKAAGVVVYKLVQGKPAPTTIKTGISDNGYTEVVAGDLKPDDLVVTKELGANGEKQKGNFQLRMF